MALYASPPRPSKRPRLSHVISPLDIAAESLAAEEELARQRFLSQSRLKSNWERIFAKYSQDFEGIADEIDQVTGKIVVDNGHIRSMGDSFVNVEDDEDKWEWEEIVEEVEEVEEEGAKRLEKVKAGVKEGKLKSKRKGKKPRLRDGRKLEVTITSQEEDEWEDTPTTDGCEQCKYKDELDNSVCQNCSLHNYIPLTTADTATLDGISIGSADSTTLTSIIKSTQQESPRTNMLNDEDVPMGGTIGSVPETVPSDAFILEKLGTHGAAVIEILAKARSKNGASSPIPKFTQADDTPRKSQTSYARGDRIEIDQSDIRTWAPMKVATWLLTHGVLSEKDDADIARALKKNNVSGAFIVNDITVDDLKDKLRIKSFSRRMQLWSGILKLKALAASYSSKSAPSQPAGDSKPAKKAAASTAKDPWAPPPQEQDPFYSHIWRDEHPDGTPARFPPRMIDPIFSTPVARVSSAKKQAINEATSKGSSSEREREGRKRKRESLAKTVPEPPNTMMETHAEKSPAAKPAAAEGMSVKTPTARTPKAGTPVAKRLDVKNTPKTRARARATPAVKVPVTKTLKTPAAAKGASTIVTPGWTTGSVSRRKKVSGKSLLGLGGGDNDDELVIDNVKSTPAPLWTAAKDTPVKVAGGDGVDGGEEKTTVDTPEMEEKKKEHKEHKCNGGFCFACLNLEGEEDDLI